MADWDWVKRTVDTAQRPCPQRLGEKCPGERTGCAFWIDEVLVSAGQARTLSGCLHAFSYVMHHESVLEAVRTQGAINEAATSVSRAGSMLSTAVVQHAALAAGEPNGLLHRR